MTLNKLSIKKLLIRNKEDEINFEKAKKTNWLVWVILGLSFFNFLLALYLAVKKIYGSPITCLIVEGCDTVQSTSFGYILGIPLAVYGALFYLLVFFLIIRYIEIRTKALFQFIYYVISAGALFAVYLIAVQFIVIKSLCFYCLVSDFFGFLNFILAFVYSRKIKTI